MSGQLGIRSKIRLESVSLENSQKQSPYICEEICTDRLLDHRRQAMHPRGFLCFGYSMCLHQKYSSSSQVPELSLNINCTCCNVTNKCSKFQN